MTIQENVDLQPYNTFGIKAHAKYFTILRSVGEVPKLLASHIFKNENHLILGGGSNLLFTKDFDGLVVKIEFKGIEVVQESEDEVTLKVGAGENWHAFVMHCVERNWGGVENLSLIPGTVGAAPMQNIGAYGVEIKKIISTVEAFEISTGEPKVFTNAACNFGYRESIFKQHAKDKYLISSITLTLTKKNHHFVTTYGAIKEILKERGVQELSVKQISDAVIHIRKEKLPDPTQIGNAGSFFKNPSIEAELHDSLIKLYPSMPAYTAVDAQIKVPAAWLIEQCGWKGKTFDNIGVHQHQALVIVNYGGGEGEKIWQLAMKIRDSVKEKFGILLQPEVNIIR
ncbi:MAG: UDP-N-acetylmuramate dehydrogenase [Cyclobacteriaceae bacterium]|nr:UDP-N-acetylmuramate dehydrogenase [Cyclobacteriaceae bacterium]MDH4297480.1 UDP-N-acetylmuramate dehydrogenase [Cyclobacteriaceae bacterium]MDH5247788.1 UDP-N-acetylmuramate dehydrogenase [Cyclobacteriaceae bacterium]